jgi:hypothetical protein
VERARPVQVQESVVAAGQRGGHVVAVALAGGIVDHPDGAVVARLEEAVFILQVREDEQLVLLWVGAASPLRIYSRHENMGP